MAELQLEEEADNLEALAARSGAQFLHFRPYIIRVEKDIRVHLELPFSRTVTDDLRRIITVFVKFIGEDLAVGPSADQQPVTLPAKLKQLRQTGEYILADLGPYAQLADHFYNDRVTRERLSRPSNEVSAEIDAIAEKAKDLWERIVKYLNDLSRAIKETSAGDEAPS
jgi:hypothetical protein